MSTVYINFILVGLFGLHLLSHAHITYFIRYIEVYFMFALVDCVRYKEDFIKSRFIKYRFWSIHFTVILAVLKKEKLYQGLCYIEVHLTEVPLVIYPVCSIIHLLNNYACHFDAALIQRLQYSYGRWSSYFQVNTQGHQTTVFSFKYLFGEANIA